MNNSGQILLEALIAIAIAAVIMTVGSQLIYVSLLGNKLVGDSDVASGLVEETFEAVRGAGTENWRNIYSLDHGSSNYHPEQSSGKWILVSGTEDIELNSVVYTRSFTVQNVCRDNLTRAVSGITDSEGTTTTCNDILGSRHDPSTQKINVTVSWSDADSLSSSEYITRWRNKICPQTNWNSPGSGVNSCPTSLYDSVINITPGPTLELCPGGC